MTTRTVYLAVTLMAFTFAASAAQATPENTNQDSDPAPAAQTAPENTNQGSDPAPASQSMDLAKVIDLLQKQQKELAEQRKQLDAQSLQISTLTNELDLLRAPPPTQPEQMVAKTQNDTQVVTQTVTPAEPVEKDAAEPPQTVQEKETEAGESVAKAQPMTPPEHCCLNSKAAGACPARARRCALVAT